MLTCICHRLAMYPVWPYDDAYYHVLEIVAVAYVGQSQPAGLLYQ